MVLEEAEDDSTLTTEVEYRSVANTSSQLTWISSLLHELGIHITRPPTIYCEMLGQHIYVQTRCFTLE